MSVDDDVEFWPHRAEYLRLIARWGAVWATIVVLFLFRLGWLVGQGNWRFVTGTIAGASLGVPFIFTGIRLRRFLEVTIKHEEQMERHRARQRELDLEQRELDLEEQRIEQAERLRKLEAVEKRRETKARKQADELLALAHDLDGPVDSES